MRKWFLALQWNTRKVENRWHGSTVGGIILLFNNKNQTTYRGKTKPPTIELYRKNKNFTMTWKHWKIKGHRKKVKKKKKTYKLQSVKISDLWLADRKSARLQQCKYCCWSQVEALKNKRKNRNKKPTKRVNPHDPWVNPIQTNFKWVGFGSTLSWRVRKSLTHTHILPPGSGGLMGPSPILPGLNII